MDASLDKYAFRMVIVILCASALMMAAGGFFMRSYYALGFALGIGVTAGLNIGKVFMLKFTVGRVAKMDVVVGSGFARIMYLARFLLTGLVLVMIHFLLPEIALFGAAIGLLSMPIASYAIKFFVAHDDKNSEAGGDTIEENNPVEDGHD